MKTILILTTLAALAAPTIAAAEPVFPGLPDQALFGICMAWQHNETGREHGNPEQAPPFAWLQQQADGNDQTVEEYCADYTRPGPP